MTEQRVIKSREEAEMFALFLACERNRHLDDVAAADSDLVALAKGWNIIIPWEARYFTVV